MAWPWDPSHHPCVLVVLSPTARDFKRYQHQRANIAFGKDQTMTSTPAAITDRLLTAMLPSTWVSRKRLL